MSILGHKHGGLACNSFLLSQYFSCTSRVVAGETCKIATYMAIDNSTILSAPVTVADQVWVTTSIFLRLLENDNVCIHRCIFWVASEYEIGSETLLLSVTDNIENNSWLQGTIGASAVILPGTTLGSQATLAPLTVPNSGSILKPGTIYMGSPAMPVKVRASKIERQARKSVCARSLL